MTELDSSTVRRFQVEKGGYLEMAFEKLVLNWGVVWA